MLADGGGTERGIGLRVAVCQQPAHAARVKQRTFRAAFFHLPEHFLQSTFCNVRIIGCAAVLQGEIRIHPEARIGTFDQDHAQTLDMDATALENARAGSSLDESDVRTVLARLNLRGDSVFKPARVLSGGERAKLALAKLLLSDVNLLLLELELEGRVVADGSKFFLTL